MNNVVAIKPQSVNAIADHAKATYARAEKQQADADDWYLRTGKILIELKERVKDDGGRWLDVLTQRVGIGERRARELMELAAGKTTIQQQRNRKKQSVQKSRARRKTALRSAGKPPPRGSGPRPTPTMVTASEEPDDDDIGSPTMEEKLRISLINICNEIIELSGHVLAREALFDKIFPRWRETELPSDVKTLVKEASTAFASLAAIVMKK